MCRLFGFKSVINSQVHSSLVHADNALISQSLKHPDGWGVAYYLENVPHIIKSTDRALDDHIFHQISGVVSSQVVLAHLRKATHGEKTILNSHPFQYGHWVFAHNGNLRDFSHYKENLIGLINPTLRRFILGSTDSEIIFFLLLTHIKKRHCLSKPNIVLSDLKDAIKETCNEITKLSGALCGDQKPAPTENHLTFIISTGEVMAALNGGQPLLYSTHKSLCSERGSCEHFSEICESPVKQQQTINHLVFSSEKLLGENIWQELKHGELVAVDNNMTFLKFSLDLEFVCK